MTLRHSDRLIGERADAALKRADRAVEAAGLAPQLPWISNADLLALAVRCLALAGADDALFEAASAALDAQVDRDLLDTPEGREERSQAEVEAGVEVTGG